MAFSIIFILLAVGIGFVAPHFIPDRFGWMRWPARGMGIFIAIFALAATSFVFIGQDGTGHRHRVYFAPGLTGGAIIAAHGERGPQADIIPPGLYVEAFLNILYDVSEKDVVVVADGHYGYLVARDGKQLRTDQTYADAFDPDVSSRMVSDAAFFLSEGAGQKGPQTSVLTPGKYRLNLFLWEVEDGMVTEIPAGFVGVIKSNVHSRIDFGNLKADKPENCEPTQKRAVGGSALAVPLVPVGCIGVWDKALNPGKYYINARAYQVTKVDTRVQTWVYSGGYERRFINLTVSQDGGITQAPGSVDVPVPEGAADKAVYVKVEGWDVPLELRVLIQVTPANAPFVVASVGGLEQVEDRILTPAIRSVVRNVVGGNIFAPAPVLDADGNPVLDDTGNPRTKTVTRPTRVLDLIKNRSLLEDNVEDLIRPEGAKAGVDIKEVRFGEPAIPPELLVARQREQLAQQLEKAFEQEQIAQLKRVSTEQARATANRQDSLVEAEIEVQRSVQFAEARRNEGLGERNKLLLIAEGQKAQVQVLGEDRVVELRKFELVVNPLLEMLKENPEILTVALSNAYKFVPDRLFLFGGDGGGNNLAEAAAVLGDLLGSREEDSSTSKQ